MKKIRILILITLIFIFGALPAYALDVNLTASVGNTNGSDILYTFKWWKPYISEEYQSYIVLPHSFNESKISISINGGVLKIDDLSITDNADILSPKSGQYEVYCEDEKHTLNIFYGSKIPSVFITTESGSMQEVVTDKSHKEAGQITIISENSEVVYNGELDYIKGRGNSTWEFSKKPFNIKLKEKTNLFDMGKSKSWSLLANYTDITGLRNKTTLDYANDVGIDYNSKSVIVDLYINGQYYGLYTLIEKVEIDSNRVDISNISNKTEEINPEIDIEECEQGGEIQTVPGTNKYFKIPENPENITGGYLLEYEMKDRYPDEPSGFVSNYGQAIVIKEPEFASKEQVEYISNYYQEFEDALRSDNGKNSKGKHYSEYIDVESFIKVLLINEFTKNLDAAMSSFYVFKDENGKMTAGPVWDFDMSLGVVYERDGIRLEDAKGIYASDRKRLNEDAYTILGLLSMRKEIREMVAEQWSECFSPKVEQLVTNLTEKKESIYDSAILNIMEWSNYKINYNEAENLFNEEFLKLKNFIVDRAAFMDNAFSDNNYYVIYNNNGGDGEMLDISFYSENDTAIIMDCSFISQKNFYAWNTKPNGCGVSYMPGEAIEMNNTLVLYAQWGEPNFIAKMCSSLCSFFK